VGRAVFQPQRLDDVRPDLRAAIGRTVDLVFVCVAGAGERCEGQNVYMERPGGRSLLHGSWVSDEDVRFIDSSRVAVEEDPGPRPAPGPRSLHALAMGSPLVLFVDDNRDTRELYRLILENDRFQVIEAEDGQAAIELARSARPDVIVMDINLPLVNGVDAIRALRDNADTARTPILAFTAHGAAMAAEAIRSGANAQLLKPCLPEIFLRTLRSILPIPTEVEQIRR
jgi:two-component system, chemotaxis family, chemotaxis protein CheY